MLFYGTLANANTANTAEWDPLSSVTLFALVEEEFGTELDVNGLGELSSFDSILDYLQTRKVSLAVTESAEYGLRHKAWRHYRRNS
jgi:hypothetical protein